MREGSAFGLEGGDPHAARVQMLPFLRTCRACGGVMGVGGVASKRGEEESDLTGMPGPQVTTEQSGAKSYAPTHEKTHPCSNSYHSHYGRTGATWPVRMLLMLVLCF